MNAFLKPFFLHISSFKRCVFVSIAIYLISSAFFANANYSQCSAPGTLNAAGIKLGTAGTVKSIQNTSRAIAIHTAWLAAGSPTLTTIDDGKYRIGNAGTKTVDRIDYGGSAGSFSGTLSYPASISGDRIVVHTSGIVSLKAGDYTIFANTDDGFRFLMTTLSGDTIVFNKFGLGSSEGEDNELRYESVIAGTETGGSFTLTQDSVFEIDTIFFNRSGGNFNEISISDSLRSNGTHSSFEVLKHGALGGKVSFGCSSSTHVNHYQIVHDGQGLTCDAENVTVRACINDYDGTCTLSTEAITADIMAAGTGTALDSIAFTGTGNADIPYTDPENTVLSVQNASLFRLNPTVCINGSAESCDMLFADAGFRFLNGASNSSTIPNQISGTAFPDELKIQAVENTNGVCTGLFNGATSLELSQENVTPSGSTGLSFTINGSAIAKHSSTSTVNVNFGSDSIASLATPTYLDAGQIRLHANYSVGGVNVSGSSNAFWVSPAELVVNASTGATTLNGASANASIVHPAGEDFDLTVTALNSLGDTTPGYSAGQMQFSLNRLAPVHTATVDGALTYASSAILNSSTSPSFQDVNLSSFVSGVSSFSSAQYSEVGVLSLDVQDANYGNEGIIVAADAINIGRFTPAYFEQSVADNGVFAATCGVNTAFAAYSGQRREANNALGAISYLSEPVLAITAYNKQGNITQNYSQDIDGSSNDFMKLSPSNVDIALPLFDEVATGIDATALPIVANMSEGNLSQNDLTASPSVVALPGGVVHYELSSSDHFYYQRSANARVAPFVSDIDFDITSIVDSDGIAANSTSSASPTGIDIRFGRLVLENAFGPETENLPQVLKTEHFTGSGYVVSADNNCTSYDASLVSLSNISIAPSLTSVLGGSGSFNAGTSLDIFYQATGAGNQGQLGVQYDSFDWLKYDWDNDGAYDDNPSATASFGVFRGDDRLLHWREQF